MSHSRAKLNANGRRLLISRILDERWPVARAAAAQGISRQRAYVLLRRFAQEADAAFEARSSRPRRMPRRTSRRLERRIERIRRRRKIGPRAIGWIVGKARSTVYAVLRRLGLARRRDLEPPRPRFQRYERGAPGDLGHIDTKRLARIGAGGGHFAHGRSEAVRHRGIGYLYEHVLVDDRSRCYYRETLPSERAEDTSGFLERALRHFARLGVRFRELMSDNHFSYTHAVAFQAILARESIRHLTIPANTPRVNGKVERLIGTLLQEVVYARAYTSDAARERALRRFDEHYHHRRRHGSLGGLVPMQRLAQDLVNNVSGHVS